MTIRLFGYPLASGEPAYIYHFGYVPPAMQGRARYGAGHGSEVGYVFDNLTGGRGGTPTPQEQKVARMMNAYWANFAKTGNPNGEGLPEWPVYNLQKEEILDIQSDGEFVAKPDPRKARLDVIEKAGTLRNHIQSRGGI